MVVIVERLIGTIRREFLDVVPFWSTCELERKLHAFPSIGWITDIQYDIWFEPTPKRVRAVLGGVTVADSTDAGEAHYWTVEAGGKRVDNAAWAYPRPRVHLTGLKRYLAFYWNKIDHWYEEDEEVFVHPRDPRKRVDVVTSNRIVKVVLGGETLAESRRAPVLLVLPLYALR